MTDPRPFTGRQRAGLILPQLPADHPDHHDLIAFRELILHELPELEAEVGCPVVPADIASLTPDEPAILVGPASWNMALIRWRSTRSRPVPEGPYVAIDRQHERVVIDGPHLAEIGNAFQILRTAIAEGADVATPSPCVTAAEVIDRLDAEVRRTFPLLTERAPTWAAAVERARANMDSPDDLATLQRLMAALDDAHSWAKDPRINGRLPYHLHDDGQTVRFWSVPEVSAAWDHGVRPGDVCLAPDTTPWRERTGSVARTKPWNIGYRALQGRVGEVVELAARRGDGSEVRWQEAVPPLPWERPISTGRLDAHTGYIRILGWLNSRKWHDQLTSAFDEMTPFARLVVDLRGNVGGALVAAQEARTRFLADRTLLGSIRYSTATGELDRPHDIVAEPAPSGPTWTKPVRFLTDPLCYSATEDFLHGLQGLPHVQVVGQTTGGGSGRPRTILLREHIIATISTALTYDRTGRCIEGNGIPADIPIEPDVTDPDLTLELALRDW